MKIEGLERRQNIPSLMVFFGLAMNVAANVVDSGSKLRQKGVTTWPHSNCRLLVPLVILFRGLILVRIRPSE